jgi:phage shock protein PspC (stress-responsive transcriptional regulator)
MAGVVVTLLFLGLGIIVYPIAGIIIPESPEEYMEQTPATA